MSLRNERGTILLAVSLILALLSVLVLSWAREWHTELALTTNFLEVRTSRRLAEAGVNYALGKLANTVLGEMARARGGEVVAGESQTDGGTASTASIENSWRVDGYPRRLKFPAGEAEVRITDEGGKINLNQAPEELLFRLFMVLGISEIKSRTMVDSIVDWRSLGDQPRPYGAKSSYYLRFDPPYVAKNGRFETVEELAWVRGFENNPIIPQLSDFLTVHTTGPAININTAPAQVLQAAGFSGDDITAIITGREQAPFQNLSGLVPLPANPLGAQRQRFSVIPSLFFTIKSKGMIKNGKGLYTIKVIVRLQPNHPSPWTFVSWMDDYPG